MYLALIHLGFAARNDKESGLRIAHFAPELALFLKLSAQGSNKNYQSFDISPDRYKFAKGWISFCDLCNVDRYLEDDSYDIILHNHILEHLPCKIGDVVKRLNKKLRKGGIHLFTVPVRSGIFQEDLSSSLSSAERKRRFAQEDHMRIFGSEDTENIFQELFARDQVVFQLSSFLTLELAELYGVTRVYKNELSGRIDGQTVFFYQDIS